MADLLGRLSGKRVTVTGAGGFIGSRLTEMLVEQGAKVRALVTYNSRGDLGQLECLPADIRQELEIVRGDVRDPCMARRLCAKRDMVFHLAALIAIPHSYEAPASYVQVNIGGTQNMLTGALLEGVERFVHTSTSEVYGTARYVPMDEGHPLNTQSPYAASKLAADKLTESYWCSFELPAVIVRPFNTFGPRQSPRAIIPAIITQAMRGNQLSLGSLSPVRDLTFVDDTCRGFMHAAVSEGVLGETINLGTGEGVSIGELVGIIGRLMEQPLEVQTDEARLRPAGSEVHRLISNNAKAKEMLSWAPQVSLEEGLAQVIAHHRAEKRGVSLPLTYAK